MSTTTATAPKYQLFGQLRDEEYTALENDCLARGIQVAVEVDEDGNILDGHHRVQIAEKHGLEYKTVVRHFKTEEEKQVHCVMLNLARRHLLILAWPMTAQACANSPFSGLSSNGRAHWLRKGQ